MNYYDLENVVIIADTGKAWLCRMTYEREEDIPEEFTLNLDQWWVPLSLIEETDMAEIGDQGYLTVPDWFAVQEEMPNAE